VNNKNNAPFELINVIGRVFIQFTERGAGFSGGLGFYIGEGIREGSSATIGPGDQNYLNLYVAFPFDLVNEIEEMRNGRDLSFQISVVYTMVERSQASELGSRFLTAEMVDPKGGGNQYLFYLVPTSVWDLLLKQLGYSEELRASRQTLLTAVRNARQAEEEATAAARATKEAANLTAVTTLAQAFKEEADNLKKRSTKWLVAAIIVAGTTIMLMLVYVLESFHIKEFTPSQTLLRVAVLAVIFGGFGLCMRTYNAYQHLELLNRHRVNIGKTFDVFIQSQPSDHAKDVLAALTAERMINFGRGTFPGKEAPDSQLSLVSDLIKSLVERPKL
jgi:hypothetical protein